MHYSFADVSGPDYYIIALTRCNTYDLSHQFQSVGGEDEKVVLNGAAVIEPHPSRHCNSIIINGKCCCVCVGTSTHTHTQMMQP
jgi:hypothetical protein